VPLGMLLILATALAARLEAGQKQTADCGWRRDCWLDCCAIDCIGLSTQTRTRHQPFNYTAR